MLQKGKKKTKKNRLEEISGFPDLSLEVSIVMEEKIREIKKIYELFGYGPLDTRLVEPVSIIQEKGVDNKEVFVLNLLHKGEVVEKNENEMALAVRFDWTVPLARYIAQYEKVISFPVKTYRVGKVYRGETSRLSVGRYCEFYQADIDVIGNGKLSLMYDVEFPLIISKILRDVFNLQKFVIRINNRKFLEGLFQEFGLLDPNKIKRTVKIIDDIEKVSLEETIEKLNEVGMDKEKANQLLNFFSLCRSIPINKVNIILSQLNVSNDLLKEGISELIFVFENLNKNINDIDNIMFDPSIARGLDYYTGTIYETKLIDFPELGSVCSGGRYEGLIEALSNNPNFKYPGSGISIGLSRLIHALIEKKMIKCYKKTTAKVLVTVMDLDYLGQYQEITNMLRENDINTSLYYNDVRLKSQLNYADKVGFTIVILANEKELLEKKIQVKDMQINFGKKQEDFVENTVTIEIDMLVDYVKMLLLAYKQGNEPEKRIEFRNYTEDDTSILSSKIQSYF